MRNKEMSLGMKLRKELLKLHATPPVFRKRSDNRDYIKKGLTLYSIAERILTAVCNQELSTIDT